MHKPPFVFVRWLVFAALALIALAIRLPQLDVRPMHTDEAVNAYITGELLAGEKFHYDPQDRHGPALFIFAEPIARFCGAKTFADLTETQLRLTPVLLGSATVLLLGAGVELFGFLACFVAALLLAVSPLAVYYSRYFIHETLFVAATLGLLTAACRAWRNHSGSGAVLAGLCAALMLACKETAVIHFFALACVSGAAWFAEPKVRPPARLFLIGLGTFLAFSFVLFTVLGMNGTTCGDLLRAIPNFAARAAGAGHEKPFGYYFHLLDSMVILSLVALAGIYAALCDAVSRRNAHWGLVLYGVLVFLIYSFIPYKTPWLALNLWLPFALLCGLGVTAFWEQVKNPAGQWAIGVAGGLLLLGLAMETKLWVFDRPADEKNPFAYAHTGDDILRLAPRLAQLAQRENLAQPRIAVVAADPWPLPWYLRNFSQVGYWQPGQAPGQADFYLTSPEAAEGLGSNLENFRPEYFGVRPGVLMILWVPVTKSS